MENAPSDSAIAFIEYCKKKFGGRTDLIVASVEKAASAGGSALKQDLMRGLEVGGLGAGPLSPQRMRKLRQAQAQAPQGQPFKLPGVESLQQRLELLRSPKKEASAGRFSRLDAYFLAKVAGVTPPTATPEPPVEPSAQPAIDDSQAAVNFASQNPPINPSTNVPFGHATRQKPMTWFGLPNWSARKKLTYGPIGLSSGEAPAVPAGEINDRAAQGFFNNPETIPEGLDLAELSPGLYSAQDKAIAALGSSDAEEQIKARNFFHAFRSKGYPTYIDNPSAIQAQEHRPSWWQRMRGARDVIPQHKIDESVAQNFFDHRYNIPSGLDQADLSPGLYLAQDRAIAGRGSDDPNVRQQSERFLREFRARGYPTYLDNPSAVEAQLARPGWLRRAMGGRDIIPGQSIDEATATNFLEHPETIPEGLDPTEMSPGLYAAQARAIEGRNSTDPVVRAQSSRFLQALNDRGYTTYLNSPSATQAQEHRPSWWQRMRGARDVIPSHNINADVAQSFMDNPETIPTDLDRDELSPGLIDAIHLSSSGLDSNDPEVRRRSAEFLDKVRELGYPTTGVSQAVLPETVPDVAPGPNDSGRTEPTTFQKTMRSVAEFFGLNPMNEVSASLREANEKHDIAGSISKIDPEMGREFAEILDSDPNDMPEKLEAFLAKAMPKAAELSGLMERMLGEGGMAEQLSGPMGDTLQRFSDNPNFIEEFQAALASGDHTAAMDLLQSALSSASTKVQRISNGELGVLELVHSVFGGLSPVQQGGVIASGAGLLLMLVGILSGQGPVAGLGALLGLGGAGATAAGGEMGDMWANWRNGPSQPDPAP